MTKLEQKRRRGRPSKKVTDSSGSAAPVKALDRGLRALVFLAENHGASLSQIALHTDTPPATMHRILQTLGQRGMAEFSEVTGKWLVGAQAFRVGNAYLDSSNIVEISRPYLERLSTGTGETVNLAIEEDGNLVYLTQIESSNPIRAIIKSGATGHLHSSGIGKALMAHMKPHEVDNILDRRGMPKHTSKTVTTRAGLEDEFDEIRRAGWAIDNEERFIGLRCVAAPIFNSLGHATAGVSVSGPTSRFPDDEISRIATAVRKAADEISDHFRQGRSVPG